jgi:hypothetical protein
MAVISQPDRRKGKKGSPDIPDWDDEAHSARDRLTSIYHDRRKPGPSSYSLNGPHKLSYDRILDEAQD